MAEKLFQIHKAACGTKIAVVQQEPDQWNVTLEGQSVSAPSLSNSVRVIGLIKDEDTWTYVYFELGELTSSRIRNMLKEIERIATRLSRLSPAMREKVAEHGLRQKMMTGR